MRMREQLPTSVLFVCHGNICRSPYAAAVFRRGLPASLRQRVHVTSAGFIGPDRPAPPEAQTVARQRDIDMSGHRSRLLSDSAVQDADLIVVMDDHQRRSLQERFGVDPELVLVLGDLDPLPIQRRSIRDPYDQPLDVFEDTFSRIERCLAPITDWLTAATAPDPLD